MSTHLSNGMVNMGAYLKQCEEARTPEELADLQRVLEPMRKRLAEAVEQDMLNYLYLLNLNADKNKGRA